MSRDILTCLVASIWLGGAPAAPRVESYVIRLPAITGAEGIRGATGSDRDGHIWLGISSGPATQGSAHLIEYDPATDTAWDRGNVLNELLRAGELREGETQREIRSRIVQVGDYLYFASMGEPGEKGSRTPTPGGHLWRLKLPERRWEHLLRTREPLVAVDASDRNVYALSGTGHVLYEYDIVRGSFGSRKLESHGAHTSRNLFVDGRGNVHVPRLYLFETGVLSASLVEYDSSLLEIATPRMEHYLEPEPDRSRGIVSFQPVAGGDVIFATGAGRLYRLRVPSHGDSLVDDLGPFDAAGQRSVATVFLDDAGTRVCGVAGSDREGHVDLIVRSLTNGSSSSTSLPYGDRPDFPGHPTFYGSATRDRQGWAYVVGALDDRPLALRVRVP